jgi:hypothetical protein
MILGNGSKVNFNVKPIEHFKNKILIEKSKLPKASSNIHKIIKNFTDDLSMKKKEAGK